MSNKKPEQQLVRRKYSPQFKDQALELITSEVTQLDEHSRGASLQFN